LYNDSILRKITLFLKSATKQHHPPRESVCAKLNPGLQCTGESASSRARRGFKGTVEESVKSASVAGLISFPL
jgi:hypothetical protein